MRNVKFFERELNLIKDDELREWVATYLENETPDYFWTEGASSSGKYHPKLSQGYGGTIRHTKAVVWFADELLRMSSYAYMKPIYKDFVVAGALVHDSVKYGFGNEIDKTAYANHARNAAENFRKYVAQWFGKSVSPFLLEAIASHMGQWSTEKEDRPFTSIDRCLHMADYMASRKFIDIPEIVEEYNRIFEALSVECGQADEEAEAQETRR